MLQFGCKSRLPHDFKLIRETEVKKWEICQLCGKKAKWNKKAKGRIDNKAYMEAHIRSFVQRTGRYKELYYKLYRPTETVIKL